MCCEFEPNNIKFKNDLANRKGMLKCQTCSLFKNSSYIKMDIFWVVVLCSLLEDCRFQFLLAAEMKLAAFSVVALRNPLDITVCFIGAYCLHDIPSTYSDFLDSATVN